VKEIRDQVEVDQQHRQRDRRESGPREAHERFSTEKLTRRKSSFE
jgi:hypothetical protein